ncbi:diguanylate cyclase/phosphodiesterase (GGDEF & EAL domains) with PAS/PAC sensor(s) [hydrothermal vent metagenome]|uniref:Diguanylate cyclase/phosphodiesterase (GGDEF & EAL domains) with PAS/PAC sensor(S) n=1 Tax=hydrothermal vent metagenome TaxID=652676 RepID=A0A1W1EEB1_9ZZZZ
MLNENVQYIFEILTPKNIFVLLFFFLFIFIVHLFVYRKKQKDLQFFVSEKIKVFKNVFYVSEDAIFMVSEKNEILYANNAAIELFSLKKYFKSTILNIPKINIKNDWVDLDELILKSRKKFEKRMHVFANTEMMLNNSYEKISVNLYFNHAYVDVKQKDKCTIVVINDTRKDKENYLLGFRHKLTKLPNQAQALNDLNALYAKHHLNEEKIALALLNIDNFSILRSIIGYDQSNAVLVKFADYLNDLTKEFSFSVYHTVHNNFLLLFPNANSIKNVQEIVKIVQNKLNSFYKMGNSNLHLTASIGISIYPDKSSTTNLLDDTYKALAAAEKNGHGRIEIYESSQRNHNYDELKLYNDMHQALDKNEFELYYQPIVDAKTKKIVSAEALIRWRHPIYGIIRPDIFIPIMEKTGLIVEVGQYILEEVLKQQKRWEFFKFRQIPISINLSLLELETNNFIGNIEHQLDHHKVSPSLIKYEITEGVAMISENETVRKIFELREIGIEISLDDFGTGYTSFAYLKKIPANILKIDRSLVVNMLTAKEDQRIVKAMIELGHTLNMKIVTEGIECLELHNMLESFGCDYMQGYYYSKPIPVFEFQKLLR